MRVGLTGNRFSGKDKVASIFNQYTVPVFDADTILKFILNYDYDLLDLINKKLGSKYFLYGKLDDKSVTHDKVFGKILDLAEPKLFKSYDKFCEKNKSPYHIFMSSILYERNWHKKMSKNITVYAPLKYRLDRSKYQIPIEISNRSLKDLLQIESILKKEMDELKKNSKGDYVIHNYNKSNVLEQVLKIDQNIIDFYLRKII